MMDTMHWQDYLTPDERYARGVVGTLKVWPAMWSPQLGNQRDIYVHLPPSYPFNQRRYPVLYMHDAQNLFDSATSYAGQDWRVDETMEALAREGLEAIVVGLPHMGPARIAEYNPFGQRGGRGQAYLDFLVNTVKPAVDHDFRSLSDRVHTAILGSSMGGLISMYAFLRWPEVFGRTGVMSPSLWVAGGAIYSEVRRALHRPGSRVYLDCGTRESSAEHMHALMVELGYRDGQDLMYVVEAGGEHNEAAWARRLPAALRFLLRG